MIPYWHKQSHCVSTAVPGHSQSSVEVLQENLAKPIPAWQGSAQSFQLSGELGWSSACTHYSEHDKSIIICLIMFNTTAAASLWNLSNTLFLVKSLNTVDFQPRRFSFSNTMLILHNTCSQQIRASWLEHKHAAIPVQVQVQVCTLNLYPLFFCLWRTDNIMLEMALTASGPLSLSIIKHWGIEEPQLPGSISPEQSMHKNYIMCWFVYLTVPVSTILPFTSKCLCSFILPSHWTALQKHFPSIPTKYPQAHQSPLDCICLGSLQLPFRHSSSSTYKFSRFFFL